MPVAVKWKDLEREKCGFCVKYDFYTAVLVTVQNCWLARGALGGVEYARPASRAVSGAHPFSWNGFVPLRSRVYPPCCRRSAARFAREAQQGPPPLPVNRMAHPGGKIVTTDKNKALAALLERKQRAGLELTSEQRRALEQISEPNAAQDAAPPAGAAPPALPAAAPVERAHPRAVIAKAPSAMAVSTPSIAASDDNAKRIQKLRKKLRDGDVPAHQSCQRALLPDLVDSQLLIALLPD